MADKKILIVEDEVIISLGIQMDLEDLGYQIVGTATTGKEAIRLARSKSPDLVIMDIRIQGDMDGIATSKIICASQNIPIIYLSGTSRPELTAQLEQAQIKHVYDFLLKPINQTQLAGLIEKLTQ